MGRLYKPHVLRSQLALRIPQEHDADDVQNSLVQPLLQHVHEFDGNRRPSLGDAVHDEVQVVFQRTARAPLRRNRHSLRFHVPGLEHLVRSVLVGEPPRESRTVRKRPRPAQVHQIINLNGKFVVFGWWALVETQVVDVVVAVLVDEHVATVGDGEGGEDALEDGHGTMRPGFDARGFQAGVQRERDGEDWAASEFAGLPPQARFQERLLDVEL